MHLMIKEENLSTDTQLAKEHQGARLVELRLILQWQTIVYLTLTTTNRSLNKEQLISRSFRQEILRVKSSTVILQKE